MDSVLQSLTAWEKKVSEGRTWWKKMWLYSDEEKMFPSGPLVLESGGILLVCAFQIFWDYKFPQFSFLGIPPAGPRLYWHLNCACLERRPQLALFNALDWPNVFFGNKSFPTTIWEDFFGNICFPNMMRPSAPFLKSATAVGGLPHPCHAPDPIL